MAIAKDKVFCPKCGDEMNKFAAQAHECDPRVIALLAALEAEWNDLTAQAEADEADVLAGRLDKDDYIQRDLQRQARRRDLERQAAGAINIPALLDAANQVATMHNQAAINHTGKLPCQYALQISVDLLTAIRTMRAYKPDRVFFRKDSLFVSWGDEQDRVYASYVCLCPDVN
jgi:hypothetical protein